MEKVKEKYEFVLSGPANYWGKVKELFKFKLNDSYFYLVLYTEGEKYIIERCQVINERAFKEEFVRVKALRPFTQNELQFKDSFKGKYNNFQVVVLNPSQNEVTLGSPNGDCFNVTYEELMTDYVRDNGQPAGIVD